MRTLPLLLLVVCVGCQPAPPPEASPTPTTDVALTPTVDPYASAQAPERFQAEPTAEPIATTIAIVRATPAPLPTPIPPSQALTSTASGLQAKVSALRAALRTQEVGTALRVQRELLAASDQADVALKTDKSTQAQSVRAAIADIRSAISSGDGNGLDHAEAALRQALGGGAGLGITATNQSTTPVTTDLKVLGEQVRGLRQAIQNRNSGEALRLQGQLLTQMSAAQKAAADDDTAQGKILRAALADLQKGLDGDTTRLTAAAAALEKLDGRPDQPTVASDVPRVAASLGAKIDAFRGAASTGSRADLLRLQQEILADAEQAADALAADQSPEAGTVRGALNDVRAGVSGDLSKLDGARSSLAKAAGDTAPAAPAQNGGQNGTQSTSKPIADLKRFAGDLDNTVTAFQGAMQRNDTSAMLRLQRQLSDSANQADASLKEAQNKSADEVRAAVASIRTAFAGDIAKLDEAHIHLRSVSGTTAPVQARVSPTAGAAPADVQTAANGLRDRVASLAIAVRDHQSAEEIARRRDTLKSEIDRAAAVLNDSNDPRLRSALGAAREAAGGDDTKAASAQAALESALDAQ